MTLAVLTIGGIAAQGDGVAEDADGQVFVPLTVPGDIVEAEIAPAAGGTRRGEAVAWLTRGPDRVEPPCRHFGQCGACALQHLAAPALATWKRERIVAALRQRGFADPPVAATLTTAAASRRRAGLGAIRTADGVQLGFSMRAGRRIVDMAECHILAPPLAALVAPLRGWLATMLRLRETADVQLLLTDTGIDLWLVPQHPPGLAERQSAARFAEAHDLARLSWGAPPEPLVERRRPLLRLGTAEAAPQPGAFLQPSREGEALLTGLVREIVGDAGRVVDLFAGLGTFSLPLAAARVDAWEGDAVLVETLRQAARGLQRLRVERRDLFRHPLTAAELAGADAVVIDPPRAGAAAQAAALAGSAVRRIAMVSCNPATFARDARMLADGGHVLTAVTPVDQFIWSAHVELVAGFVRP